VAEPPRLVRDLTDVVLAGERTDVVDDFEDAALAVVDAAPDSQCSSTHTTADADRSERNGATQIAPA
jgi:hypothetical protein